MLCPSVAAGESLLEPSHPQDDVEEELPDGLDESCGTDEEEDSECPFPRELCPVPQQGGECRGCLGARCEQHSRKAAP